MRGEEVASLAEPPQTACRALRGLRQRIAAALAQSRKKGLQQLAFDLLAGGQPGERSRRISNAGHGLRQHRPDILRFLYWAELDATNNLAERQLRPAVITRKTGGCNRSTSGARTHAILASVLATCRQQAVSILEYLIALQQFGATPPELVPATA